MKLENIFIGSDGRLRLGDFGLTMSMKQELAISPVGTVEYMAPEARPTTLCCFSHGTHSGRHIAQASPRRPMATAYHQYLAL